MKLLMTCDMVGGVWQYATDLSVALADQGVKVVLAVLGPSRPVDRRVGGVTVIESGLPLDWLAATRDEVLGAGHALATLAAAHDVDLVQLNAPALGAATPWPAPVVAVAHGCVGTWCDAMGERPGADLAWHRDLVRAGLLAADAVVAPSTSHAAAVQRHYALPTLPQVVHNGRRAAASAPVAVADHVLTAGRLWDRAKDVALLDATAALLPVPLRAAGPATGPRGETAETRHLHLLGRLDDGMLAAEYARQPIFVSTARFEPFGLAVLEAAQAGCPLLLAGIDSFRELWTGAALFVTDDDPAAWAAAIGRVRADPALRAHLSEAARLRAARYSVEAMAGAMAGLYRDLLARLERRAA